MSPEFTGALLFFIGLIGFIGVIALIFFISHYLRKKAEAEKAAWVLWATQSGYTYQDTLDPSYLSFSSFDQGTLSRSITGVFPKSGNGFALALQTEVRGSGKNRREYKRTVAAIDIPDTRLHVIINSKINNDAQSGGNISNYAGVQRFSLEGDFGDFYDVYMPETTQSETLSMLTPDSMLFVLENLADYDIEITGPKLYVYTYRHLGAQQMGELIGRLDTMLEQMRLRKDDTRAQMATNALVARTATSAAAFRPLKKDFNLLGALTIVGIFVFQFINHPVVYAVFFVIFALTFGKMLLDGMREQRLRKKYNQIIARTKP